MFRVREFESIVDFSNVSIKKTGSVQMKMQKKIGKKRKGTEKTGQYLVQVNKKYKANFLAVRTGI